MFYNSVILSFHGMVAITPVGATLVVAQNNVVVTPEKGQPQGLPLHRPHHGQPQGINKPGRAGRGKRIFNNTPSPLTRYSPLTGGEFVAIQLYISTFKQILLCRQKGMNTEQIAFAVKKSNRLVKEYEKIIDGYAGKSYKFKELLETQPNIESNTEKWINEYAGEI